MRIGDLEVIPLSDGTFWLDGGAMFGVVPKVLWSRRVQADDRNRIPLSMTPLLVRTGESNVLIDAGAGNKLSQKELEIYGIDRTRHLDASLAEAGLTPGDIDLVIATHLHFDHAGGFTIVVDGRLVPRFPRARYIIRRGEWQDATAPNERTRASYLFDNYVPLLDAGVVDFVDDDGDVAPGISLWRTGGHTAHHQIVRLDSGGQTALYLADLVPTSAHLADPWVMGYDLYPLETMAAKQYWLRRAVDEEYVIFFEHDPAIQAGRVVLEDGKRRIEPILPSS